MWNILEVCSCVWPPASMEPALVCFSAGIVPRAPSNSAAHVCRSYHLQPLSVKVSITAVSTPKCWPCLEQDLHDER